MNNQLATLLSHWKEAIIAVLFAVLLPVGSIWLKLSLGRGFSIDGHFSTYGALAALVLGLWLAHKNHVFFLILAALVTATWVFVPLPAGISCVLLGAMVGFLPSLVCTIYTALLPKQETTT